MPAIAVYNRLQLPGGPLPSEIFDYEPNIQPPIPTQVTYQSRHADGSSIHKIFRQELDGEERLISSQLEGKPNTHWQREWTSETTYQDTMFGGGLVVRNMTLGPDGQVMLDDRLKGVTASLQTRREEDEDDDGAQLLIACVSALRDGRQVFLAEAVPDSGEIMAETTYQEDDFDTGLPPITTSRWEYNEDDRLTAVTRMRGDGGARGPHFTETYERVGHRTLEVVGSYVSPHNLDLVLQKQWREYDSGGRVELIRSHIHLPETARQTIDIQLSYE